VRRHLGEVLLKLERPREAVEQWERALAFVFPERPALARRLQQLLSQLARTESAGKTAPVAEPDPENEETP
jgi:hypothetical protein